MATYNKPHLTLGQQVALLSSRGMEIDAPDEAERWLSVVGYYRLSGYWYPYRQFAGPSLTRADDFVAGTTFDKVIGLYDFDRRLKLMVLDALERIEVAMRFRVGYILGLHGAFAHLDPSNFDRRFTAARLGKASVYIEWRDKLAIAQQRSKEDFVTHFDTKYDGRLPVWVATELLDFGGLSFLYEGMQTADRNRVAIDLNVVDANGVGNGPALANWMRVLNYLRNICAHHSRLWNRNMTDQIATRHLRAIPSLAHLADPTAPHQSARPYASLCVVDYLLGEVAPGNTFAPSVTTLIDRQLTGCGRMPKEMGFPDGWRQIPPWAVTGH